MDYTRTVNFSWDQVKSDRCFKERGFDFSYAIRAFLDPEREVFLDDRWEYGESRYVLRGMIDDRLFVLVFTYRDDGIRVISARKANKREVTVHERGKHKS